MSVIMTVTTTVAVVVTLTVAVAVVVTLTVTVAMTVAMTMTMTDTFFNLLDMVYPSLSRQNNFNMLNFVSDVDDCFVGPCSNGGNCTDLVDDFHCSCAAGWTGKQCTTSKFSYPNKIIHCHNYQLLITITKNWPTKKIVGAIRRVYRTNKSNSYLDLLNSLKSKRTYFIGLKTLLRQI